MRFFVGFDAICRCDFFGNKGAMRYDFDYDAMRLPSLLLPKFRRDFAQISPKSNQVYPNLTNFAQIFFATGCGCIPSSYGTGYTVVSIERLSLNP